MKAKDAAAVLKPLVDSAEFNHKVIQLRDEHARGVYTQRVKGKPTRECVEGIVKSTVEWLNAVYRIGKLGHLDAKSHSLGVMRCLKEEHPECRDAFPRDWDYEVDIAVALALPTGNPANQLVGAVALASLMKEGCPAEKLAEAGKTIRFATGLVNAGKRLKKLGIVLEMTEHGLNIKDLEKVPPETLKEAEDILAEEMGEFLSTIRSDGIVICSQGRRIL